MKSYIYDLLEEGIVKQVAVTVAAAATSGKSALDAEILGGTVIGVVPNGNQDQFIDSVSLTTATADFANITLSTTDPVEITAVAHGLATGDRIEIAGVSGTTELNYGTYAITKVDADNFTLDGTDSSDFTAATTKAISGVTLSTTDPVVLTVTAHGLETGDKTTVLGVVGTTELNGNTYTVTASTVNTLTLVGTDSSAFTAYTSGGTVYTGGGTATAEKAAVTVTLAAAATANNVFNISVLRADKTF